MQIEAYFPLITLFLLESCVSKYYYVIIKRASGASKAFSLVMKTNNYLRLRVFSRNACLHLAYVSIAGVRVFNWRSMCPQLAYMSSLGEYVFISNRRACLSMRPPPPPPPLLLGFHTKNMHLRSRVQVH